MMAKPWDRPIAMESTAQSSQPAEDTAAKAVTPSIRPITSVSTRLYIC